MRVLQKTVRELCAPRILPPEGDAAAEKAAATIAVFPQLACCEPRQPATRMPG